MQRKIIDAWYNKYTLHNTPRQGFGFEEFSKVVKTLGWQQDLAPIVITVAGTNGKGSCVAALDKLFSLNKAKVLSFMSPHIISVNERFNWCLAPISDEHLSKAILKINAIQKEHYEFSFFEFTTLIVFYLAKHLNPDVLLLEVGLGGRLDAVNATTHNGAVITSVDLDHQDILGNSLQDIAKEKAGIIQNRKPVFLGDALKDFPEINQIIKSRQALLIKQPIIEFLRNPILPKNSLQLAYQVWQYFTKATYDVTDLLTNLSLSGRFEVIEQQNKHWIFDIAHNPAACSQLAARLQTYNLEIIVGFAKNKDILECIKPFKGLNARWHLAPKLNVRNIAPDDLGFYFNELDITNFMPMNLKCILSSKSKNILVFGSATVVGWLKADLHRLCLAIEPAGVL